MNEFHNGTPHDYLDRSSPVVEFRRNRQEVDYIATSTAADDQRYADFQHLFEDLLMNDSRMPRYDFRQLNGEVILRSPDPRAEWVQFLTVDASKMRSYRLTMQEGSYAVSDASAGTTKDMEDVSQVIPKGTVVTSVRHEWKSEDATTDDPQSFENDGLAQLLDECRSAVLVYEATKPRKTGRSVLGRLGLGRRSK